MKINAFILLVLIIVSFFGSTRLRMKLLLCITWIITICLFTFVGRASAEESKMVLIPFGAYFGMLRYTWHYSTKYIAEGLIGNVLLFVPLGILLKNKKIATVIIIGFCCSLAIELLQLVTRLGTFEVDDLIHNTFGAVVGFQVIKYKEDKRIKHLLPAFVFLSVIAVLSLISIIREIL